MKGILIIAARELILTIFVASIAFYSFVLWHWRNDAKRRRHIRYLDRKRWNMSAKS